MRLPVLKSLLIFSPAKLNLFLDVLCKRPDGYHEILTLFERISLSDSIHLTELSSDEIVISSTSRDIPCNGDNLAYKAAELLKASQGIKRGIKIDIEKNIPVCAGLGGGSSNAASVLLGLNKLFGLKLKQKTLLSYANRLGSDVAFFILGRKFALGRGRGGDLEVLPMPKNAALWHLLFVPRMKVATKDVYEAFDREKKGMDCPKNPLKSLKLTKKTHDVNILLSHLKRKNILLLNRNIYNRLSETVMKSYSLVSELKSDLSKYGLKNVHMSGSGPTLFANFRSRDDAVRVLEDVRYRLSDRCDMFLTSTL